MRRLKTILQEEKKEIKKVNDENDLENNINLKDWVRVSSNSSDKIYEMRYDGVVNYNFTSKIYHSFIRMDDDCKNIVCWRSEIIYLQFKDGVIIFNESKRHIETYSPNSVEFNIKQKTFT